MSTRSSLKTYRANGTIRVGRIVMMDAADNNSVLEHDGSAAFCVGITQIGGRDAPIPSVTADPVESAQVGEDVNVHGVGDDPLCESAATIVAGDIIQPDAQGRAVVAATTGTENISYVGFAETAAASGEYFNVAVVPGILRPAIV